MVNKFLDPYLVNIGSSWIDVRGKERKGKLHWHDPRDGISGIAERGDFIRFYPRQLSLNEL